jgi:CBS domain-containing protein
VATQAPSCRVQTGGHAGGQLPVPACQRSREHLLAIQARSVRCGHDDPRGKELERIALCPLGTSGHQRTSRHDNGSSYASELSGQWMTHRRKFPASISGSFKKGCIMTAGEVCNRQVVFIRPETSIVDAVALMKTHYVGDVVVVREPDDERVPVGILTDRDVALAVDRLLRLPHLRVADVMSADLVTSHERESLYDVLKKMQSHGIRRLPVVNDRGGLEGILTFDDVIELLSEELTDLAKLVAKEQKRERDHAAR